MPHYPIGGLNSGVILMDLGKMRDANYAWLDRILTIYSKMKSYIPFCDQVGLILVMYSSLFINFVVEGLHYLQRK